MYILCPEAFKSYILNELPHPEAGFLKEFFSSEGAAVIASEVWESFRYVLIESSTGNPLIIIAQVKGFVKPEQIKRDSDHKETAPQCKHNQDIQIGKTKELVERNYADIDCFITPSPEKYSDVPHIEKVPTMTAEQFYIHCMKDHRARRILERHATRSLYDF